jgi:RHS repeat-associated protein
VPSGATTYTFDANGSQTADSTGWAASYTHKDQTASITPAGGSALNFTYQDTTSTNRTAAGSTTFDNTQVGLARAVDSSTSTTTYYLRTPAGGVIGQNVAGTRHYYLTDALGSTIALIDTSGTVANTYSYDPWGVITATTGTVTNPYRYAGGYYDTTTGLTKFGTRYYDPTLGRWTQRDPSGHEPNAYNYASCSPVNTVDPSGTWSLCGLFGLPTFSGETAAGFGISSAATYGWSFWHATPLSFALSLFFGVGCSFRPAPNEFDSGYTSTSGGFVGQGGSQLCNGGVCTP